MLKRSGQRSTVNWFAPFFPPKMGISGGRGGEFSKLRPAHSVSADLMEMKERLQLTSQ